MNIITTVGKRGDVIAPDWLWGVCSEDESRFVICSPWSCGDWTYATNGRALLRMPRLQGVPENEAAPKQIDEVIGDPDVSAIQEWWTLDAIERGPVTEDCEKCGRASAALQPVELGALRLRNDLLQKMACVPGARFAPEPQSTAATGRCLMVGDGRVLGILMGMHRDDTLRPCVRASWSLWTGKGGAR